MSSSTRIPLDDAPRGSPGGDPWDRPAIPEGIIRRAQGLDPVDFAGTDQRTDGTSVANVLRMLLSEARLGSRGAICFAAVVTGGCWFDIATTEPEELAVGAGGAAPSTESGSSSTMPYASYDTTSSVSGGFGGQGGSPGDGGAGGIGGAGGLGPPQGNWTSCEALSVPGTCLGSGVFVWFDEVHPYCEDWMNAETCFVQECAGSCIDTPYDNDKCGFECDAQGVESTRSCQEIATANGGTSACYLGDKAVLKWTGTDCWLKLCDDLPSTSCKANGADFDCYF